MRDPTLRLLTCLLGLLAGFAFAAPARAGDPHVLVLGRISDDPKAHYEQLKPLLDYVVPRMADVGITEGRILMARDLQQMTSYLRRGRVDWVTETAANAMRLEDRAGARPLLLTERNGVNDYRALIFVRRDSGIASLDDLHGRSVAFQNTSSTSAYVVPAMQLLQHGLPLQSAGPVHSATKPASGHELMHDGVELTTQQRVPLPQVMVPHMKPPPSVGGK